MTTGNTTCGWILALVLLATTSAAFADTRSEMEDLMARYAWLVDQREATALGRLFYDNGSLEIPAIESSFTGPVAIADFFTGTWKPLREAHEQRRHVITNLRILEEAGDRTSFTAYMSIFGSTPTTRPGLRMIGFYEVTALRRDDQWRFQKLRINIDNPVGG
jgi:3-phenylpropionate/cinnamic acid dioxygenase small subunit